MATGHGDRVTRRSSLQPATSAATHCATRQQRTRQPRQRHGAREEPLLRGELRGGAGDQAPGVQEEALRPRHQGQGAGEGRAGAGQHAGPGGLLLLQAGGLLQLHPD